MPNKVDLESWNLVEENLATLEQLALVRIHLLYPNYPSLLGLVPRERRRAIETHYRQAYRQLLALLPSVPVERIGSAMRPTGIQTQLRLKQLPPLLAQEIVRGITLETIEGMVPQVPVPAPRFWCLLARFAIQIENETGGLQKYEDRLLVIRALSEQEARAKLTQSFQSYAEPYLNSGYQLVRWQFEAFLDSYELDVRSIEEFGSDKGVEVFSTLHTRRLRPEREWHPKFT